MATNNSVNTSLSGQTGTGNFVGANTPTLITPVLGAATGTSLNFGASATNGIVGVTGGTSAASGVVGEIISSTVTSASATSYTSTATSNLTSITLSAGEWVIHGNGTVTGTVTSQLYVGISATSATQAAIENRQLLFGSSMILSGVCPMLHVTISSPTTYYMIINATSTGSPTMCGNIIAQRIR